MHFVSFLPIVSLLPPPMGGLSSLPRSPRLERERGKNSVQGLNTRKGPPSKKEKKKCVRTYIACVRVCVVSGGQLYTNTFAWRRWWVSGTLFSIPEGALS